MGNMTARGRWVKRLGLLAVAVSIGIVCWILRPPTLPGTLGVVSSRVRVGLHQDEVIALIRASGTDNVDCFFTRGETRDGRPFLGLFGGAFDKVPAASDIAWGELEIDDNRGRELFIDIGPGGVVSGVRLTSPVRLERWRHAIWHRVGR